MGAGGGDANAVVGIVELGLRGGIPERVLPAKIGGDALANGDYVGGAVGQESFAAARPRDFPQHAGVAVHVLFVE